MSRAVLEHSQIALQAAGASTSTAPAGDRESPALPAWGKEHWENTSSSSSSQLLLPGTDPPKALPSTALKHQQHRKLNSSRFHFLCEDMFCSPPQQTSSTQCTLPIHRPKVNPCQGYSDFLLTGTQQFKSQNMTDNYHPMIKGKPKTKPRFYHTWTPPGNRSQSLRPSA